MADFDQELSALCKALGHPARVRIVRHLLKVSACYFGSLTEVLDLAPSTISQHVSALKRAGLITEGEKDGRKCHCIKRDKLARIKVLLDKL